MLTLSNDSFQNRYNLLVHLSNAHIHLILIGLLLLPFLFQGILELVSMIVLQGFCWKLADYELIDAQEILVNDI